MTAGRPTKLTPELQDKLCELLRVGIYADAACAIAGVAEPTFYEWLQRGESEPNSIYAKFAEAIKKATSEAEYAALRTLHEGENGWQAKAWFLERRFPRKYGRRDPEYAELRELKDRMAKLKQLSDTEFEQQMKQLRAKEEDNG